MKSVRLRPLLLGALALLPLIAIVSTTTLLDSGSNLPGNRASDQTVAPKLGKQSPPNPPASSVPPLQAASSLPSAGRTAVSAPAFKTASRLVSRPPAGSGAPSASSVLPVTSPTLSLPVSIRRELRGVVPSDRHQRRLLVEKLKAEETRRLVHVRSEAERLGYPQRVESSGGKVAEIIGFKNGEPLYLTTFNRNAAVSTGANILRAPAPFGRSLQGQFADGSRLQLGIWDAGWVRRTHQEFGARVENGDSAGFFDDHATHVGGTMVAGGVRERAMGMAPAASMLTHDWIFDLIELLDVAALLGSDTGFVPVSNHSYGIVAGASSMGVYEDFAAELDGVAFSSPYCLPFWAAGNDQDRLRVYNGYQSITHYQLAKNIVTVGAVEDAVLQDQRASYKGLMADFSSWGPSDDGRIKPDLVANGVALYSPVATGNTAYDGTYSGTSMASPNAAGTAAQLVQLHVEKLGALPRADLLKAILIHAADDLGKPGPDYQFGWGLVDAEEAASLVDAEFAAPGSVLLDGTVNVAAPAAPPSYSKFTKTFFWDGRSPIKATLVWIDPAGEPQLDSDSRDPNLVHDLDMRIRAPDGTTVHEPFTMPFVGDWSYTKMSAPAVPGDNNTDNVEQILITSPTSGQYTLEVEVDGELVEPASAPEQKFAVILTGTGPASVVNVPPTVSLTQPLVGAVFLPYASIPLEARAADTDGAVTKVEFLADGLKVADGQYNPGSGLYYATWTPPTNEKAARLWKLSARAVDDALQTNTTSETLVEVHYPLPGQAVEPFAPPATDGPVYALGGDASGRLYIGGSFSGVNGYSAPKIARLRSDGGYDDSFLSINGPDDTVRALLYSGMTKGLYIGGDFKFVAGQSRKALARMTVGASGVPDGTLDAGFAPILALSNSSSPATVRALLEQADGRVIIGGNFSHVNGVPRENLARLNLDGTLDSSFAPRPLGSVHSLAELPDGRLYVGGAFTSLSGPAEVLINRGFEGTYLPVSRSNSTGTVAGVLPDGWTDNSLTTSSRTEVTYSNVHFPAVSGSALRVVSGLLATNTSGARFEMRQRFHASAGKSYNAAVWVKADEPGMAVTLAFKQTLSPFNVRASTNAVVTTNWQKISLSKTLLQSEELGLALSMEGKGGMIVDEATLTLDGPHESRRLVRLHSDGAIDRTFSVGTGTSGGFDGVVYSVGVGADGSIYAGGAFSSYAGRSSYNNLVKLNSSGTLQPRFNSSPGLAGEVRNVHVRPSGQILVSGNFTNVGNSVLQIAPTAVGRIVQFNEDGSLDEQFNKGAAPGDGIFGTGANAFVNAASSLANGNVLAAGGFTLFNGASRDGLVVVGGYDSLAPVITSRSFAAVRAGSDFDFTFAAASPTSQTPPDAQTSYSLVGGLPRGLQFDSSTGRLTGVPLDSGSFNLSVVASTRLGSVTNNFQLSVGNVPVSYESWRRAWFQADERANSAVSGPLAVRGGPAALPNLLVYALDGGNPSTVGPSIRPSVVRENINGTNYLTLSAPRYSQATLVPFAARFATNLATGWRSDVVVLSNSATRFKARAPEPATNSRLQLMQLSIISP